MLSYKNSTNDVHLVYILSVYLPVYNFSLLWQALIFVQTFHWLNKNLYTIKKIIAHAIIFTANVANNIDVDFIFT